MYLFTLFFIVCAIFPQKKKVMGSFPKKDFGCEWVVVCVIIHSVLYCLCYINRETKKILLKDKN